MRSEILVVIATFFTTIAQLSFKLGSADSGLLIGPLTLNPVIAIGFVSYAIAALLFINALRGGELSLLYPLWSLSFVWIFLASSLLLKESVTALNWLGVLLIILGVSFVGRGSA
ncbi:MAG: hypothetical protein HY368_01250 [Candidatus Aenigmarchaeota archaeon]|nr:hypothetical protein [Candidatus Aenigmarchaeota archaeon]